MATTMRCLHNLNAFEMVWSPPQLSPDSLATAKEWNARDDQQEECKQLKSNQLKTTRHRPKIQQKRKRFETRMKKENELPRQRNCRAFRLFVVAKRNLLLLSACACAHSEQWAHVHMKRWSLIEPQLLLLLLLLPNTLQFQQIIAIQRLHKQLFFFVSEPYPFLKAIEIFYRARARARSYFSSLRK